MWYGSEVWASCVYLIYGVWEPSKVVDGVLLVRRWMFLCPPFGRNQFHYPYLIGVISIKQPPALHSRLGSHPQPYCSIISEENLVAGVENKGWSFRDVPNILVEKGFPISWEAIDINGGDPVGFGEDRAEVRIPVLYFQFAGDFGALPVVLNNRSACTLWCHGEVCGGGVVLRSVELGTELWGNILLCVGT